MTIGMEITQFIDQEVAAAKADIQKFWNAEEPIVVSELKTVEAQLASIVTGSLVTVLQGVASGTIKSSEQFGALVTSTYQSAIKAGLAITITDAQTAATQVVSSATAALAPAA
jgi:hypothetical protein